MCALVVEVGLWELGAWAASGWFGGEGTAGYGVPLRHRLGIRIRVGPGKAEVGGMFEF